MTKMTYLCPSAITIPWCPSLLTLVIEVIARLYGKMRNRWKQMRAGVGQTGFIQATTTLILALAWSVVLIVKCVLCVG